ncbi:outer membrane beta-barrel protein [Prevotella sp.]|uniref:outer membrane beta-barrel protein n=1 Tax=Prevotella sp. TaxID=59823 RepID=UPI003DA48EA6
MKRYILFLIAAFVAISVSAQRITHDFRDVSMSKALKIIEANTSKYRINFIYNELEDFTVTTSIDKKTIPDAIRDVIGFYPIRMTVDGDNIFVECVQKESTKLIGEVVDKRGQPIVYANISLLSARDSTFINGGVSNLAGKFVIPCSAKHVLVKVSCIGYKTILRPFDVGDIGKIVMTEDMQVIKGIVVKGYRPIIKHEEDKTIFDINQMPKIENLTSKDVLKFAPGVIINSNGDIKMAGKKATVFVNGRQLSDEEQSTFMTSLKASEISKIELSQNHGGENDASIQGGIINIITKKNRHGFTGNMDLYSSTPQSGYYNITPSANMFFGTEKWNIYGSYSYTKARASQYGETENNYLYNGTKHAEKGSYLSFKKQHVYRIGAIFNVTPKHTFGLELNGISSLPTTHYGKNDVTYTLENNKFFNGEELSHYYSHSDFYNIVGSYNWNFDNQKSLLKVLLNYNNKNQKTDNRLETNYLNYSEKDVNETDVTSAQSHNITSNIDLRKNFLGQWSFLSGVKLLISKRNSFYSVDNNIDASRTTAGWKYRENIYGGYIGGSKNIGNLFLKLNFRLEKTNINGHVDDNNNISINYTNFIPYIFASYNTAHSYEYSFYYTKSINRPQFFLMNGYVNRISDVLYDKGNPNLKAEVTDMLNFTVSHARHTLSLIYNHTPNTITEYFEVDNGITYHTNINYGITSSLMLNYSYSGSIFKWWQTNLYLSGNYTRIPQSYYKTKLFGGEMSFNNRMIWNHFGILSIGASYNSPFISGNLYCKGSTTMDLSIEHSFLKDALTIQLGTDDLFNGSKTKATNRVPTLEYNVYIKNQTRQIWCRIAYNFSTKSKTNKNKIDNYNSIKDRL